MNLTPAQVGKLEQLLAAGFRFASVERAEKYTGVTREGFIALLDSTGDGFRVFGQVGYWVEGGIAMLVERGEGKAFVWHARSIEATPELLEGYRRFREELERLLGPPAKST